MAKYSEECRQVSYLMPAAMVDELRARARQIASAEDIDISYVDLMVAAACRCYEIEPPSLESATLLVMLGGGEVSR